MEADDYKTLTSVGPLEESMGNRRPYLVVVSGPDASGQSFLLEQKRNIVVGRANDATIRINDAGISRHHVQLRVAHNHVELLDLGSKNGTFIEGDRIETARLDDGQKFQIGSSTVVKILWQDSIDEAFQQNLYESSVRDPLTQAYNRRFLIEVLQKDVSYCLRHKVPLTLVMLDVDRFKLINDTRGHPAGDEVLRKLSDKLQECIRNEDVLARYGGEEFAIVLRECGGPQGLAFAERVRVAVEAMIITHEGRPIPVTVSVGVASLDASEINSPEALIAAADRNLYRAKDTGRNRVVADSPTPF